MLTSLTCYQCPAYTSQDCPSCGNRQKKSLSQRTHHCNVCSYIAPRDTASAISIRDKAAFVHQYRSYPTLIGEVKPPKEIQSISVQEESTQVESGCDASTISPEKGQGKKAKRKRAVLEVSESQSISKEAQTLIQQVLEADKLASSNRAPDIPMDSAILTHSKRRKKRKSQSTAQRTSIIQLELDLGDTAVGIASNTL